MSSAVASVASPSQIIKALMFVLRSVTDLDAILTYEKDYQGNIAGKFRSDKEIFDYLITPDDKVSFVASPVRADSYLGGYYLSNAQLLAHDSSYFKGYTYAKIARLDRQTKGKNCKVGQRCKNTCIAKGLSCDRQSLPPKQSRTLGALRTSIPSKPKININAALLATAVVAAGVGLAVAANSSQATQSSLAGKDTPLLRSGRPPQTSPFPDVEDPWGEDPVSFPDVEDPWEGDTPVSPPRRTARTRSQVQDPSALPNPQSDRPGLPPARRKGSAKSVEVIRSVTSDVPPEGLTPPIQGEARPRRTNQVDPASNPGRMLPPSRGKNVSDSLNFFNFDEESTRKLENTRDQVSKVINAPGLSRMTVAAQDLSANSGALAQYEPILGVRSDASGKKSYSDLKIGNIAIDPRANKHGSVELSLIHEIGHAIDHQLIDSNSYQFASNSSPELEGFRTAARNTKAYKKTERLTKKAALESTRKAAEYALGDREVFARAFEQYVVKKSNSKVLKDQFKARQEQYKRTSSYWDDDDFKEIENELDKLFKKKGWR